MLMVGKSAAVGRGDVGPDRIHAALVPVLAASLGRVGGGICIYGDTQLWRMRNTLGNSAWDGTMLID